MKVLVSPAEIDRARKKAEDLLFQVYGPAQTAADEKLCWDGKIANVVDKSGDLINSGKMTKEQIEELLTRYERERDIADGHARTAQDQYWELCTRAGLPLKPFSRPECRCRLCGDRYIYEGVEAHKQAIMVALEAGYTDETVALLRETAHYMKSRNIVMTLDLL